VSSRLGLLWTAFTAWLCVCTVFSLWRTDSLLLLRDSWITAFVSFLVVAGLVATVAQCRKAILVIAVGTYVIVLATLSFGILTEETRLQIFGTFGNSNDLATFLLIGIPFCAFPLMDREQNFLWRISALVGTGLVILTAMRTGSRGGLVAMAVILLFLLRRASFANKLKLTVAIVTIGIIALFTLPETLLTRYGTIFTDQETTSEIAASAEASENVREELLKRSVKIAGSNLVFGVGPGQFRVANAMEDKARGGRERFIVSHNTFTEVATETGVPGILIYLALLYTCFKTTKSIAQAARGRPELQPVESVASCLRLCVVGFCAAGMFGSLAYSFHLPVLTGLILALEQAVNATLRAVPAKTAFTPTPGRSPHPPLPPRRPAAAMWTRRASF
jgi:O-antigen ligase